MSQEAAPERAVPEQPVPRSVPEQKGAGSPKGLLQQMEELMAALSADLSQLDADLQSTPDHHTPPTVRPPEPGRETEPGREAGPGRDPEPGREAGPKPESPEERIQHP
ncbi:hypothetical protein ACIPQJ_19300 [Streptomyces sp. NPDC090082]|uniref:hypothetical protein n=1 Tax=unclassified Streptomyces TaxID=2593676 RepID=UPI0037FC2A71